MKDEIKQALEKATPGPWQWENKYPDVLRGMDGQHIMDFGDNKPYYPVEGKEPSWEDSHLIANAPTWLRWQNERIEELEKALEVITSLDPEQFQTFYDLLYFVTDVSVKAIGKEQTP